MPIDRSLAAAFGPVKLRVYAAVHEAVKARMARYSLAHDFAHVSRVVRNALTLCDLERAARPATPFSRCDRFLCAMGALVHDWADKKLLGPGETIDDLVRELRDLLVREGLDDAATLDKLEAVARGVGYSKRGAGNAPPDPSRPASFEAFPEFFIVEDADALDAMGPLGHLRCAAVCGERGLPLYAPQTPWFSVHLNPSPPDWEPECSADDRSYADHYQHKILRLAGMMHTPSGRARAEWLRRFDVDFLNEMEAQVQGVWRTVST